MFLIFNANFSKKFLFNIHTSHKQMLLKIFQLKICHCGTLCVSNTRKVISGPADGQIESYASSARELSTRVCSCARNARRLIRQRPCVLRTERRYCVSGRFNCDEVPKPTTTFEGHISILEETRSKD